MKGRRTRIWPDKDGKPLVTFHEIDGMGHGTPVLAGEGGGSFMLETGFSSTLEIAKAWGLVRKWKR